MKKKKSDTRDVTKLKKKSKEEHEKSNEYLNRLKYLQADFENYRKRVEKTILEAVQLSKEKLIINLLSVVDELELALRLGKKTQNKEALLEGIEMTLKKMYATLRQEGLTEIESVGKPFNPKIHEAVSKVPTENHDENTIIEEVRRGFIFRDKVIRQSMVKVAAKSGVES